MADHMDVSSTEVPMEAPSTKIVTLTSVRPPSLHLGGTLTSSLTRPFPLMSLAHAH